MLTRIKRKANELQFLGSYTIKQYQKYNWKDYSYLISPNQQYIALSLKNYGTLANMSKGIAQIIILEITTNSIIIEEKFLINQTTTFFQQFTLDSNFFLFQRNQYEVRIINIKTAQTQIIDLSSYKQVYVYQCDQENNLYFNNSEKQINILSLTSSEQCILDISDLIKSQQISLIQKSVLGFYYIIVNNRIQYLINIKNSKIICKNQNIQGYPQFVLFFKSLIVIEASFYLKGTITIRQIKNGKLVRKINNYDKNQSNIYQNQSTIYLYGYYQRQNDVNNYNFYKFDIIKGVKTQLSLNFKKENVEQYDSFQITDGLIIGITEENERLQYFKIVV